MSPRYCKHGDSSKCCVHCDTERQLRFEMRTMSDKIEKLHQTIETRNETIARLEQKIQQLEPIG